MKYTLLNHHGVPMKIWDGSGKVPMEAKALEQLGHVSQLSIVGPHVSLMPDGHFGIGSTVGSVIPTRRAIIPASVGVDIGCGMVAVRTSLTSHQISENAQNLFEAISAAVPHGGAKGKEVGNWTDKGFRGPPTSSQQEWANLEQGFKNIVSKHGQCSSRSVQTQLGTLGGGNHFIEVCLDESDFVWFMLHSGSRGVGNRIGSYFIELAKDEMDKRGLKLPSRDLAYFDEGAKNFADYVEAVSWAQDYAMANRVVMMEQLVRAVKKCIPKKFELTDEAINCHHNYVNRETHFGEELFITRKGAVSAREGELGIIPGSMGTRSFITRGKGNPDAFCSCSHGAGRVMARCVAKGAITLDMHRKATEGVVCRKDKDVVDESPAAYKNIDDVMAAQSDLVDIVHTLKQVVCVKG